jgi:exonuclease III
VTLVCWNVDGLRAAWKKGFAEHKHARNVGRRIDYVFVSDELRHRIAGASYPLPRAKTVVVFSPP